MVEEGNIVSRRSKYEAIYSFDLTDFTVLTMGDLRDLIMGVYQLKQAPQYTREHLEPEYELVLVKDDPNLIRCKIQIYKFSCSFFMGIIQLEYCYWVVLHM